MSRKTVTVAGLVDYANSVLRSNSGNEFYRRGVMRMIEPMLHETGNYKGFRYLLLNEIPIGNKPGINYIDNMPHPDYAMLFANTDNTRIQYYI
ncbi:MAG: hypothetical protein NTZ20_05150 [Candidatus Levybacteria bacterium]|nr:hypothetical protein [Candidatus Levybacteria bacterium]